MGWVHGPAPIGSFRFRRFLNLAGTIGNHIFGKGCELVHVEQSIPQGPRNIFKENHSVGGVFV